MKTLYINIDNEQIQSTDYIEILNYNLLDDFFFYLGDAIVGDISIEIDKIDIIKKFNTTEYAAEFAKIMKQWNDLKSILFSDSPEGTFKVLIPTAFIDWIRYNENDKYRYIYEHLYCNCLTPISINLDVKVLYNDLIGGKNGMILKQINRFKEKTNDWKLMFNYIYDIHSSLFFNELKSSGFDYGFLVSLKMQKNNNKYGYVNYNDRIIIPFIYEKATPFSIYGLAIVEKDNKTWIIDFKGRILYELLYKQNDLFVVNKEGKCGLLSLNGNIMISLVYDKFYILEHNLCLVKKESKYGMIDFNNNIVVPIIYDRISPHENFCYATKDNKTRLFDFKGALIYEEIKRDDKWRRGWSCVKKDGKYGWVTSDLENIVIPIVYDDVYNINDDLKIGVKDDEKWIISNEGKIYRLSSEQMICDYFYLYRVDKDGKYGYINDLGTEIIPCEFDHVDSFHNNLFIKVYKDTKFTWIDFQGNELPPALKELAHNGIYTAVNFGIRAIYFKF